MKQTNIFTGNIISDIDVSKIKPDGIVFPTVGIRVFNKAGKGLIATVVPGNEELFSVTDGFMIVGAGEYEGVAYIFSHNPATGEGEVGTYPTPNRTSAGFSKYYAPLLNYYHGAPMPGGAPAYSALPLRTVKFNFDLHHPVDVVAKKSYDNTVDLYFIDFYNPDRVINNGFKITGESVPRYVYLSNFDGALNHIPFTNKEVIVNDVNVTNGGFLKPGNIFVYVRYLTANYAKTNFVKEIGPISISIGDTQKDHAGYQEQDWTTGIENTTDRKINLDLGNLDANFAYFQIGIVRYSATTENGPAQQDVWMISNYYPITAANKVFSIYGNEPQESLTYSEILKTPFEYPISKTQVQLDKRLLKANVKRSALNYVRSSLIAFASNVVVGEFYHIGDFATKTVYDITASGLLPYSSADDVYKYLGYFKEQVYPFACIFKFSDGTLSEAFPCKGNLSQATEKGLYQFGDWKVASGGGYPNQNIITGVSFDTTLAKQFYNNNVSDFASVVGFYFARADRIDNFLCQGVAMHGYHGALVTPGDKTHPYPRYCSFQGEILADPADSASLTTRWDPSTASIMPLYRGYMPITHEEPQGVVFYGYADDNDNPSPFWTPPIGMDYNLNGYDGYNGYNGALGVRNYITFPARWDHTDNILFPSMFTSISQWDNSHGIFSPDILFDNGSIVIPPNAVVKPLFKFDKTSSDGTGKNPYLIKASRSILPKTLMTPTQGIIGIDLNSTPPIACPVGIAFLDDMYSTNDIPVESVKVEHMQGKGNLNFASYFPGEGAQIGFDAKSSIHNKDIGTCSYIGVRDISSHYEMRGLYAQYDPGGPLDYRAGKERTCIVNLYKNSMTSSWITGTNDAFNISSVQYSPISELVTFDDLVTSTWQYFKGDCFLQKVWIRTHRWYALTGNNDTNVPGTTAGEGTPLGWGRDFIDEELNWYQHGFMVGMTVECRYNAGMRNEVIGANTANQYLKYTFFPKAMQDSIDLDQWAAVEPGKYAQEATQINAGYNKVISDKTVKGYDFTEPVHELNKPNRVYATDAHIAGSFLDGYRSIQDNSYQDFALEDGDINYIGRNLSYAFIVQRNGTNQIFINERSMGTTDQGQDVILGTSLTFFSDKVEKIGWYGTQHKSSVVGGVKGTYGYDWLQNIWWMLNTERMQSGQSRLKMEDLSGSKFITDELTRLSDGYSTQRDAVDDLIDDPISGTGIVGFADIDNEEVGMTFMFPEADQPNGRLLRTIIYSEKIEGFRGDYPFAEHMYFNLGNMLLGQHSTYKILPNGVAYNTGKEVYLYNVKTKADGTDNYATFFGTIKDTMISFIINGGSEKENTTELIKIFNSMEVEMKDLALKTIIFTTQYQTGTYDFSTTETWKAAEYLEHKWHVPVIIQTSADNDAFETESELRGAWVKVTLVYNGDSDIELKSVISDFDISFA